MTVVIDTSVWIEHLRSSSGDLSSFLRGGLVLVHPMVMGEISLGRLAERETFLHSLSALPRPTRATDAEVLAYVNRRRLYGRGIGYVDAHLLVSTLLTPGARLWTRDRRLAAVAQEVGVALP